MSHRETQKGKTMSKQMLSATIPWGRNTLTDEQVRARRAVARAEKALIAAYVWEAPERVVKRRERSANRAAQAWRKACEAQR